MGEGTSYCARCKADVTVLGVWSGWIWVRRAWYAGIAVLCALAPIIMSEITLLLPLACVFGLAAGPIHALARERATCRDCGAEIGNPMSKTARPALVAVRSSERPGKPR
jgi:hypothetical protein